MNLPSYLKLTESERAFELKRRQLKTALSEATAATKRRTSPVKPLDMLTPTQLRQYEKLTAGRTLTMPDIHNIKSYGKFKEQRAECQRRFELNQKYHADTLAAQTQRLELQRAEQAARQAYTDHLNTAPASDLE